MRAVEDRPRDLADQIASIGAIAVHVGDHATDRVRPLSTKRTGPPVTSSSVDHTRTGRRAFASVPSLPPPSQTTMSSR